MFLEFGFVGVPSVKNNKILPYDFHPSRDLWGPENLVVYPTNLSKVI